MKEENLRRDLEAQDVEGRLGENLRSDDEWLFLAENLRLEISYKLAQLRSKREITQDALARKIGISPSVLSRFFRGNDSRSPNLDTLVRLAWALGKQLKVDLVDLDSQEERELDSCRSSTSADSPDDQLAPVVEKEELLNESAAAQLDLNGSESIGLDPLKWLQPLGVKLLRFSVEASSQPNVRRERCSLLDEHCVESVWKMEDGCETLHVRVNLASRPAGTGKSTAFPVTTALFDVGYRLRGEGDGQAVRGLRVDGVSERIEQHCLSQALPIYSELLDSLSRKVDGLPSRNPEERRRSAR